ncbi:MAG: DUF5054 domain-containing protein [Microthrixaceae bacterium]
MTIPPDSAPPVRRVLYVAKTHLDVGFTDRAAVVRQRYLDDFFPRAVQVSEQLRAAGGPAALRWTTGSWILSEALDAADAAQRRRLEAAIEQGALCWHALPFTLHTEFADRSLVEHGLGLSAELDRRFGRRTRAAKATDVPGHTRALVSLLADVGVDLLHVGVNPAASAPRVPEQFRWRDDAAAASPEIQVMYQPGGYGDLQVVAGTDVAVVVDLTGDNLGPRSAEEITATFAQLADRFPGADVQAASFEDVAEVMARAADALPVITQEIGDTWIHGTGSAPGLTAGFRALGRLRRRWLDDEPTLVDDPAMRAASTTLLQVAEHTWGLDQKTHWPELAHWSADDLATVRDRQDTMRFEASWQDQRDLLDRAVAQLAIGHADLAAEAHDALAALTPVEPGPDASGCTPVDPARELRLDDWTVRLDPDDGAVSSLVTPDSTELVAPGAALARFVHRTHDAADFERWFGTYNASTRPEDEHWARWDNTKPGLERSGAVARSWTPTLEGAWTGTDEHGAFLLVRSRIVVAASDPVSVPQRLWTRLRPRPDGSVAFELSWFGLRAARWPCSVWWSFAPAVGSPEVWRMRKLDEWVSPLDVVADGGRRLHVADRVAHPDGVELELVDTGLVAPGHTDLLVWDDRPVDMSGGWHVALFANLWGTNFPMWTEGDARFRVVLRRS